MTVAREREREKLNRQTDAKKKRKESRGSSKEKANLGSGVTRSLPKPKVHGSKAAFGKLYIER